MKPVTQKPVISHQQQPKENRVNQDGEQKTRGGDVAHGRGISPSYTWVNAGFFARFMAGMGALFLCACTTVQMPNGAKLSTPADIKNVTMTGDSFHADEINHAGIYKSLQGIGTMLGVGAFLP